MSGIGWKGLAIAGTLLLLAGCAAFAANARIEQEAVDALSFSNTMTWDPVLLAARGDRLRALPQDWEPPIALPDPPRNSSARTEEELELLLAYELSRTPQQEEDIRDEIYFETTRFGPRFVSDYADSELFPKTALLLRDTFFHDVGIITLREKEKFDRVRPSILDKRLSPSIEVPGHPAYPSAHSTQFHFLALVLGALDPANAETYWARADEIALRREIAGVHYPSDSAAGVLLAQHIFAALMETPSFQALLEAARSEWQAES